MKNLAAPLGLAGFGSRSKTERSDALFFDWRVAGIALCVFAGYYLGAKLGFALTFNRIRFRFSGRLTQYCSRRYC